MNNAPFSVDELEVDVLEPRLEMAQVATPPSLCQVFTVRTVENAVNAEIQKLTYSTCYPG